MAVVAVFLLLLGGSGTTVAAATSGAVSAAPASDVLSTGGASAGGLNESLRQLGTAMRSSGVGSLMDGKRMTVHVTGPDGTTETRGIVFDSSGDVRVRRTGFDDPALTARLADASLRSITSSEDPGLAAEKAIAYDLITFSGSGSSPLLTGVGVEALEEADRSRLAVAEVDLDGDSTTDAILEIEALDADGDGEFDRLVRTVVRDADDDGTLETIASSTRPVEASVTGSVTLDFDDDGGRDTLLRLTGVDTDADGRMDRQRQMTLLDTRGDDQFDVYSETVGPITPATTVTGDWTLTREGRGAVRMDVEGVDSDGDDRFDRKVLSVAIDLDGEPGFESTSETAGRVHPTLRISAEFDTDGDGTPDTKVGLSASDPNGDGALESTESTVVNDSDGDGDYDTVVDRSEVTRGFISNTGESIRYLNDPRNLTILGVIVSVLGILIQLVQGG